MPDVRLTVDVLKDDSQKCVFVLWRGRFDAEAAATPLRELMKLGVCDLNSAFLHDARQLTFGATRPAAEVTNAANSLSNQTSATQTRKIAIAVEGDLAFGLMRMYGAHRFGGDTERHVFKSMPEALAWLGLAADQPDPFAKVDDQAHGVADRILRLGV